MAHIEVDSFEISKASANIFTANLTLDSTTRETIIRTIKDGGDKQNRETNIKASMTDWYMQDEPGFAELEE